MTSIGSRLTGTAGAIAVLFLVAGHAQAVPTVTIQPAYICNDGGTGCAAPVYDASVVQDFWLNEASLTVNILPTREFHSTEYQTFSNAADVTSFLLASPHPDPNGPGTSFTSSPITFWFSDLDAGGLVQNAVISGNRSWVRSNADANIMEIAIAQALGHNLGLSLIHEIVDTGNLMDAIIFPGAHLIDRQLTPTQIEIILASRFVQDLPSSSEVPLPATLPLFATGLGLAMLLARRKRSRQATAA